MNPRKHVIFLSAEPVAIPLQDSENVAQMLLLTSHGSNVGLWNKHFGDVTPMQDIKKIIRALIDLFCQFIMETRSIVLAEDRLAPASLRRMRQAEKRFIQEAGELLKTLRLKISEMEEEIHAILHPKPKDDTDQASEVVRKLYQLMTHFSVKDERVQASSEENAATLLLGQYWEARREHLAGQALKTVGQLHQLIAHLSARDKLTQVGRRLSLRDQLIRDWEERPAGTVLADYRKALVDGDTDMIEVIEAEGERVLRHKGDPWALKKFHTLKAQALESRLSPVQKDARAALEELRGIKKETTVALCFFASLSRACGVLLPLGTNWRSEIRQRLDGGERRGISVTLRTNEGSSFPVTLLDWSKGGLRVQATEMFPPGTILGLALEVPGLTEQALSLNGEVRWFQGDESQPGCYILGIRIVEEHEAVALWQDLFPGISSGVEILSSFDIPRLPTSEA